MFDDDKTANTVWWGDINQAFDADKFEALYQKMTAFVGQQKLYAVMHMLVHRPHKIEHFGD